jgi:hypothetical protein
MRRPRSDARVRILLLNGPFQSLGMRHTLVICWFERRAMRLGFLIPFRRIRDISADFSFAVMLDHRD